MKKRYSIPIGISVGMVFLFFIGFIFFMGYSIQQYEEEERLKPVDFSKEDPEILIKQAYEDFDNMALEELCQKYGNTDWAIKNGYCEPQFITQVNEMIGNAKNICAKTFDEGVKLMKTEIHTPEEGKRIIEKSNQISATMLRYKCAWNVNDWGSLSEYENQVWQTDWELVKSLSEGKK